MGIIPTSTPTQGNLGRMATGNCDKCNKRIKHRNELLALWFYMWYTYAGQSQLIYGYVKPARKRMATTMRREECMSGSATSVGLTEISNGNPNAVEWHRPVCEHQDWTGWCRMHD